MPSLRRPELLVRLTETWFRRPRTPTRLVLSLTRRCNLRCQMCRTWAAPRRAELSAEELGAALRQMPGLTWLDLTGGEIFLRADLEAVFDAVLDATPALRMLHFPTNGWFTRRVVDLARRVAARRPEVELVITVSLDGPPAVHDAIRGRAGSFARALETYRQLRALDALEVYVGTTITEASRGHLDALEDALRAELPDFDPREWHWNWQQTSAHFFDNAALAPPEGADELVRRHLRRRGRPRRLIDLMELGFLVNLRHYQRGGPVGMTCQALRSSAFVSPEGDLYPCHVYDRPLGSLREGGSVEALWASPEVAAAREDVRALRCGGCFTPCEAYPTLAGAPVRASLLTARRLLALALDRAPTPAGPAGPARDDRAPT